VNDEWGRIWKEAIVCCLQYYPGIRLKGAEESHENLSWFPGEI
jgi:hypothetical protein